MYSSQEHPYYQRYMAFTKRAVFLFLLVCVFGYSLQGLDSLGIQMASWPLVLQWVALVAMIASIHHLYNRYYQVFSQLYDKILNKVCDWILDYVFNIHQH